jgi:hypothetical protein
MDVEVNSKKPMDKFRLDIHNSNQTIEINARL